MKTLILLSILLFGTLLQTKAQNVLSLVKPRSEISFGFSNQLLMPNVSNKNVLAAQNLPYPIIFIHGLNSSSDTWIDMGINLINEGLSFGGRIDFCLNDDGNNYTSNKNIWTSTNNNIPAADIALYSNYNTDLSIADFYFINFKIDNFGRLPNDANFSDVLSNEAAIAKQGVALKLAIQMVLLKTGRDKVILMGHSMGGLAAREYVQNPSNWQPDGNHHVAKLITTGTPHGGYTGTNNPFTAGRTEAYRDLRKEYSYTGYEGVYLYGGYENSSIIKNVLLFPFYNVDVNCNGIDEDNTYITGLNYKTWISSLDYSYIIGVCTNCFTLQANIEGDGIVRSVNADLSSFTNQTPLPTPKNEFIYTAAQTGIIGLHSELPQAIPVNFRGLDEPNEYNLAYEVNFSNTYKGFITVQPNGGYPYDYDDYKFSVTSNSQVSVLINNTFSNPIFARILNSNNFQVGQELTVNSGSNALTLNLSAGLYYLEIYTTATSTSYLYPYTFTLSSTLSSPDFTSSDSLKIYPNPTTSNVYFDNTNSNFKEVSIYNYLGQEVSKTSFASSIQNQEIDMSTLTTGVYVLKFSDGKTSKTAKIIKQ
ncbi:MAG: alpha/beta fold hydrolase [Flavobacterium sp.]|uniref:alpha/beta fold hydrolase n=1 Tax=Flavobacterium sp. TaxID=239 RepID=UPI003BE5086E